MKKNFIVICVLFTCFFEYICAFSFFIRLTPSIDDFIIVEFYGQYKRIGLRFYFVQQKFYDTLQINYSVEPSYIIFKKWRNVELSIGGAYTLTTLDSIIHSLAFSPSIGITGKHSFSNKFFVDGEIVSFIYSDGFSMVCSIGGNYKLTSRFSITMGSQSISNFIMGKTFSSFFKVGMMIGCKYEF
jgi:hypothetical protein